MSDYPEIASFEIDDEKLILLYDENPWSPREWDNLGTMICFHNRYDLGDEHDFSDPDELIEFICENDVLSLPLYLYDHSGITMNTTGFSYIDSGGWDSGQVGFIYVTKEVLREEFNKKRLTQKDIDHAYDILNAEVKIYNYYLTGEVYGYALIKLETCDKCGHTEESTIDSCFGFYGSDLYSSGILECVDEKWHEFIKGV